MNFTASFPALNPIVTSMNQTQDLSSEFPGCHRKKRHVLVSQSVTGYASGGSDL